MCIPSFVSTNPDRAYRIGQDKPVFVHKLLCQDTVEQRIHLLQQNKAKFTGGLLADADITNKLDPAMVSAFLEEWCGGVSQHAGKKRITSWPEHAPISKPGRSSLIRGFRNRNFRKTAICNDFESFVIVLKGFRDLTDLPMAPAHPHPPHRSRSEGYGKLRADRRPSRERPMGG